MKTKVLVICHMRMNMVYTVILFSAKIIFCTTSMAFASMSQLCSANVSLFYRMTVDLSNFLCELERLESEDHESFSRFDLNADTLKHVLHSMHTEYDKSVLKATIFATSSRKKVYELGIKPDNAVDWQKLSMHQCKKIISLKSVKMLSLQRIKQLKKWMKPGSNS